MLIQLSRLVVNNDYQKKSQSFTYDPIWVNTRFIKSVYRKPGVARSAASEWYHARPERTHIDFDGPQDFIDVKEQPAYIAWLAGGGTGEWDEE